MSDKNIVQLDRLKKLIDGEKSRQTIADKLECDVSTITKHYNGDRNITTDYVIKYAKYFNVSTDYLLGLSDVATTDTSVKAICDYTGLDEELVEALNYCNDVKRTDKVYILSESKQAFNNDFCNSLFKELLLNYSSANAFFKLKEKISSLLEDFLKIYSDYKALQEQDNNNAVKTLDYTAIKTLKDNCFNVEQNANSCLFGLQQNMIGYINHFFMDYFKTEIKKIEKATASTLDIEEIDGIYTIQHLIGVIYSFLWEITKKSKDGE